MGNDMPDIIYAVDFGDCYGHERYSWDGDPDWHDEYEAKGKYYSESHVQQLIKEAEERQREKCAYQLFKFRSEFDGRVPTAVLVNLEQAILNAGGE